MTAPGLRERERAARASPLRIVAVGGGTGLPTVLAGLRAAEAKVRDVRGVELTAVVATSDDGGSSGELRRRYGMPAPGDVRNCLVALSGSAAPLAARFQHRLPGTRGRTGHTVGNLVLAALTRSLGGFLPAVDAAGALLQARGRVIPATDEGVELVAALEDGRVVRGECAIAAARGCVRRLYLDRPAPAVPAALEAIAAADLVVLGPGSLYSSVIAPLLAGGVADALRRCRGTRVLVVNLLTEPGETDGYTAAAHVRAVVEHAGAVVDFAVVNDGPVRGTRDGLPVVADTAALTALGATPFISRLALPGSPPRHDPVRLARLLLRLARVG